MLNINLDYRNTVSFSLQIAHSIHYINSLAIWCMAFHLYAPLSPQSAVFMHDLELYQNIQTS